MSEIKLLVTDLLQQLQVFLTKKKTIFVQIKIFITLFIGCA